MSALDQYMTSKFAGAQKTNAAGAGYYHDLGDANNNTYNCFAYAVGKTNGRINAQTRAQLDEDCKNGI